VWLFCRIFSRKLSKKGTRHAAWRMVLFLVINRAWRLRCQCREEDSVRQSLSAAKEGIVRRRITFETSLSPDDREEGSASSRKRCQLSVPHAKARSRDATTTRENICEIGREGSQLIRRDKVYQSAMPARSQKNSDLGTCAMTRW